MDEAVKRVAPLLLMLACVPVLAQPLQDPTRPPASLQAPGAGGAGAAGAAAGKRAPQLQSVLIGRQPGGRHIAVIDGETLRLGDLYQGARVTRIEQHAVELRRGNVRQVLRMDGSDALTRTKDLD